MIKARLLWNISVYVKMLRWCCTSWWQQFHLTSFHTFGWRLKKKMAWPIFQCGKTNSEGPRRRWRRGAAQQMAREIGIRINKRDKTEKKWRHQRLCHFRSARQPGPAALTKTTLAWPSPWQPGGDENPTSGTNKVAPNDAQERTDVGKQMRRTKGASRSRDRRIRWLDGGRARRGEERGKTLSRKRKKKKHGTVEGASVPVECWRCLESRCRSRETNISL